MQELQKKLVIVIESTGQEKATAQIGSMANAAKTLGATLNNSFSSFNEKTGKLTTSFDLTVTKALALTDAVGKINRALQQGGLSRWVQDAQGVFKIQTDLSRIREAAAPSASKPAFSDEWKAANAMRAEANRQMWAEEARLQKEAERRAKDSARLQAQDYVTYWKQALREKEIAEQNADRLRQTQFLASVRAQQSEMMRQVALSKSTAFYGAGSAQEAQAKAVIQEASIRAKLQADIDKIQARVASGSIGQGSADARLSVAFRNSQTALNALNSELAKHRQELDNASKSQGTFAGRVIESIGIYRVFNATINTAIAGLQSIPKVGIQLEQTSATLTAVFGSFGQAANQMQFLNAEAERTGLKLEDLRKSYATFSASALLAGQSAATVQRIFADVNTTATTLHLTTDQVNGVFLALSQMFNKGKVQAEELTKQLSQTLPGITNQAAKALGLSAAELGESMKKGLITADGAVQKMMARMAEAFGGEAFVRASSNLNAELGRLSTSWTHFAENVYKATEGAMTSTVRATTGMVNSLAALTSNTYDTERAIVSLGSGIGTGLLASLAAMALSSKTAKDALALLKGESLAFQAVAGKFSTAGIVTGLSLIASAAVDTQTSLAKARAEASEFMKEKAALAGGDKTTVEYKISQQQSVQETEGNIKRLQERYKNAIQIGFSEEAQQASKEIEILSTKLLETKKKFREEFSKTPESQPFTYTALAADDKVTKIQLQNEAAKLKREGKDRESAILTAKAGFAEELKILNGEKARIDKVLFEQSGVTYKDYQQALKDSAEIDKQISGIQSQINTAGDKPKAGAIAKQLRGDMAEASTVIQEAQNKIGKSLDALESRFSENLASVSQYYTEKRRLSAEDVALQQQEIKEQINLAAKAGDSAKVRQLELKSAELAGKAHRENEKSLREEQAAYRDLGDSIKDLNSEYLAIQGKGEGSSVVAFDRKYRELRAKLDAEIKSPQSADSGTLASASKVQMDALRSYTIAADSAAKSQAQVVTAKEVLAAKEQRIQNGLKLGSLSEIEALYQTQQARQEAVRALEDYVTAQEKALVGQPEESPEVRRVKALRLEIENLAADSNVFAAKFENIFSTSFANAFGQFRQGSLSAKEAFASFANSVIDNIAQMAEQALAKQVFGLLAGALSNSALSTPFSPASYPLAAANGGVFSGLSGASGTVLTQPTYFPGANVVPFANGGVLAGEAGKEAVIPMKTGSIPVKFIGGGNSAGGIVIQNLSVSIVQKDDATSQEQAGAIGKAIKEQLNVLIEDKLANATRPGRTLNPTQLTATF